MNVSGKPCTGLCTEQDAPSQTDSPLPARWENKDVYATAIRNLRVHELQNPDCMTAVRAGLGSIIPLQLLTTLTPLEMELRTCGLPYINLEFLKVPSTDVDLVSPHQAVCWRDLSPGEACPGRDCLYLYLALAFHFTR